MSEIQPLVSAHNVQKSYGDNEVLKGIDLDVFQGEVVVILGPSGSGKSTFLRCINHLEDMNAGSIMVGEEQIGYELKRGILHRLSARRIAHQRQKIGMVFQQFNLYPHMTVLQNIIEAPVHVQKRSQKEVIEEAEALLHKVGLYEKRNAWPSQLSGGQQQRVAIARALAQQPKALLFDEPTSALDPELVGEVLRVIRSLAEEGRTMIIVTHEMGFARDVSNKAVFLHQGKIEESGPPQQVFTDPLSDRCRAFVSSHLQRNS